MITTLGHHGFSPRTVIKGGGCTPHSPLQSDFGETTVQALRPAASYPSTAVACTGMQQTCDSTYIIHDIQYKNKDAGVGMKLSKLPVKQESCTKCIQCSIL